MIGWGAARLTLIVAAVAAALVPLPAALVERAYSTGVYPPVQRALTAVSNQVALALFDAVLGIVLVAWIGPTLVDALRVRRLGGWRVAGRAGLRTATIASVMYLAFLTAWGFNYRRVPIVEKVRFDDRAITVHAARELAVRSARELNALFERRSADAEDTAAVTQSVDASLAPAFSSALEAIGSPAARPARPKRTLLDPYFRSAGVDGMTDPFFLETLVASDLLPVERPFVVAHEWSHLGGFADEGEANFIGWLTCLRGSAAVQYSGWLFLYREVVSGLPARDRDVVARELASGPRADLEAIAARLRRHIKPRVAAAGWKVYDAYLKANRIDAGAASYAEVVRLVLGTKLR
jgi:hypothetical protein